MADEQLDDKENQFRKRARRRLVGAVALVLLMVTVLPMILDDRSGQNAPQPEIAINIPSRESGDFTSSVVPAPATKMESPVAIQDVPQNTEAATIAPEPKVDVAAEPKPESTQPQKSAATEKPVPAEAPVSTLAVKKSEDVKPAKAEPVKKAVAKPLPAKGQFIVQVGVFSEKTKVDALIEKIASKKITCYTEDLNTKNGVKIRLRCGPYGDRTKAEKAQAAIKSLGLDAIVVSSQ